MILPHSPINPSPALLPERVEGNLHAPARTHDLIHVILPLWPNRVDFIALISGRCYTIKKSGKLYQLYEQIQHPRVEYWTPQDEVLLWEGDDKRTARALIFREVIKGAQ